MQPAIANDPTIRIPEDRPNENRSKSYKPVKLNRIVNRLMPIKRFPRRMRFLTIDF